MIDNDILLEDLDNAWLAVTQQYVDSPDDSMRVAMNLLARIKGKLEARMKEREKEQQRISMQAWLDWLNSA